MKQTDEQRKLWRGIRDVMDKALPTNSKSFTKEEFAPAHEFARTHFPFYGSAIHSCKAHNLSEIDTLRALLGASLEMIEIQSEQMRNLSQSHLFWDYQS